MASVVATHGVSASEQDRVSLAPARLSDITEVARLFAALHRDNAALDPRFALSDEWLPIFHEHFVRTVTTDAALWLLAWSHTAGASDPVGLLVVEAHHDSLLFQHRTWAELVALYVAPQQRGSGLAQLLMTQAQDWAAEHGFDRLQLYVTATNERARIFYRRCGGKPVQEIWRLDVQPISGREIPRDPSCDDAEGCGADVLESGHHHLAMEVTLCRAERQELASDAHE